MTNRDKIQKEALDAIGNKHRAGLAISMGVGKTKIGLDHMKKEYDAGKRKFLVVAPKLSIFESWKEDAKKFNMSHLLEYITFSTYRSLNKQANVYDVIYLDECHSLLESSHDWFLSMCGGKIIGLTGTPPRYGNSEKGRMVTKYCPMVYHYEVDDAVKGKILNDYRIIVHILELDSKKNFKVKTKKGGAFYTSERENYDYWCKRLGETFSPKQRQIFTIMRMQALMKFNTKEVYAKQLLKMISGKCIVFCNTTEQAERVSMHVYHSKNAHNKETLDNFKKGKFNILASVLQLEQGVNIPNLKNGIILHSYSNERKSSQRLGRLLRLNPDDKAYVHILMYKDTIDEVWVEKALEDFDQEKIIYHDPNEKE